MTGVRVLLRRALLAAPFLLAAAAPEEAAAVDPARLEEALARAASLDRLHALIVARDGEPVVERVFRGPGLDTPVNVKSVAKSVIAALVGAAIDRGVLTGADQPIGPLLGDALPGEADPRVAEITLGDLLSMRSGLERTSGPNYGRWVASGNWVRHIVTRPFVAEPGGQMLYSTGNSHLLSAILTRATGRSTLALARDWLGRPLGIDVPAWDRDPQGIYLGGNNMALAPRDLLRFGELYRRGGIFDGRRVLPESWIDASWTARTRSPFSGDEYGYGWFLRMVGGYEAAYARGFGGQLVVVVPELGMTVVATSDQTTRTRVDAYGDALWALIADGLVPAARAAAR